eukprot:5881024-Heterocapsa_arctica.AAC.1
MGHVPIPALHSTHSVSVLLAVNIWHSTFSMYSAGTKSFFVHGNLSSKTNRMIVWMISFLSTARM